MRQFSLVSLTLFSIVLGAMWCGVHVSTLFQPAPVIIVFGSLSVYLFVAIGPTGLAALYQSILQRKLQGDDIKSLERIGALGFLFGGVSVVIGFIHVFQNLTETELLGSGIAMALTGLIYGALPAILINLITGTQLRNCNKSRNYMGATAAVSLVFLGLTIFALSQTNGV